MPITLRQPPAVRVHPECIPSASPSQSTVITRTEPPLRSSSSECIPRSKRWAGQAAQLRGCLSPPEGQTDQTRVSVL